MTGGKIKRRRRGKERGEAKDEEVESEMMSWEDKRNLKQITVHDRYGNCVS